MKLVRSMLLSCLALAPVHLHAQAVQTADPAARVDVVFADWNTTTLPGCAVGVARDGRTLLERAYGMADLEHDVPNTPATVFEAGSVSKQFTAAAIVLLAEDGGLSLEDEVHEWVPELPAYPQRITLRHLLTHTSGLRDWGAVAAITGWSRSARTHTHAHVLDILSHQHALNFPAGSEYSYSNSGYNLLAIIAERASGQSLREFSRTRIFEPLGMTHTQWRDDYTRLVEDRATAYAMEDDEVKIDRPIENIYGNGGLLTTVGDLLRWNEALANGRIGGPQFTQTMQHQGVLTNGDTIAYANGLFVDEYRGVPEVSHTGATSGYRAFLAHYPDERLDVAVLCNVGDVSPSRVGHGVADAFLVDAGPVALDDDDDNGDDRPDFPAPDRATLAGLVGTYYSADAELTLRVELGDDGLVLLRRPATRMTLEPVAVDRFTSDLGRISFVRDSAGEVEYLSVRQSRVYDLRFQRMN